MVYSSVIQRPYLIDQIRTGLDRAPVVVLTGPRQCGKATLARQLLDHSSSNYFDLENPVDLLRLTESGIALRSLDGLVVIDEVQRRPELFPLLRVLMDEPDSKLQFLILGSPSGDLLLQSSESLAGRVVRVSMGGFVLREVGRDAERELWLRGGFPRSFLAPSEHESIGWRREFMQTLLERDFPQRGVRVPSHTLHCFWSMLAHYHAREFDANEPAQVPGVNQKTTRRYLDLLTDALMIRQLQPLHVGIGKRQLKKPKIYVRDPGLYHQLIDIKSVDDLMRHLKLGASWEGFAIEQILMTYAYDAAWFWGTHQGAEIDLVIRRGNRLFGVEVKWKDAPGMTPSLQNAKEDLGLSSVIIAYPGTKPYEVADGVKVIPLQDMLLKDPFR